MKHIKPSQKLAVFSLLSRVTMLLPLIKTSNKKATVLAANVKLNTNQAVE
jgi:hypothetical protein